MAYDTTEAVAKFLSGFPGEGDTATALSSDARTLSGRSVRLSLLHDRPA